MSMDLLCGEESKNPKHIIELLKFKRKFLKEHPDYFDPDGLLCFVGSQGTGKTLSLVNYVCKLLFKYPKAKLVSNLLIEDYPIVTFDEYISKNVNLINSLSDTKLSSKEINDIIYKNYLEKNRVFEFCDNDDLSKYDNGEYGVIFLIDEIQLYMNSLQSKNINMDTMTELSQQRKQRKHIVCSSQVFGRMAKPLREQFNSVIVCKCYCKTLQVNKLVDRDSLDADNSAETVITGEVKRTFTWFHSPKMYERYDTYYKIRKGNFASADDQKGVLYDNRDRLSSDS